MRKAIAAMLMLALCLPLSACGREPAGPASAPDSLSASAASYTAAQIAWALWEKQDAPPAASQGLSSEDPGFGDYLGAYYRLDPETVEDGYLRYAGGVEALELAVLRFREASDAERAAETLAAYQDSRAGDFTGYLPEQAAMVESGLTVFQGSWAALLLCPKAEEARETFLSCLDGSAPPPEEPAWPESAGTETDTAAAAEIAAPGEEADAPEGETAENPPAPEPEQAPEQAPEQPPEQPPEQIPEQPPAKTPPPREPETEEPENPPEPYDGQAVRDAWASGDTAELSEKSLAVLEAAREVIGQEITEGMSGYDKELAIHDWMLAWGSYDHGTLDHTQGDQGTPDNENPYGFLILQKGICSGYASTFQLFMDLLDIQCVTVDGTAHSGTDPHAWNLVRLDGDWYAVDVTWDDPTGGGISEDTAHRYFNVTSQFLRGHDHQWTASVPEAEGTALAWAP